MRGVQVVGCAADDKADAVLIKLRKTVGWAILVGAGLQLFIGAYAVRLVVENIFTTVPFHDGSVPPTGPGEGRQ